MITRSESIYVVFPMLITFTIIWGFYYDELKKPLLFSSVVLLLWFSYKIWELTYFGSFLPNTAFGEDINLPVRLRNILSLNSAYLKASADYGWIILREFKINLFFMAVPFIIFIKNEAEKVFLSTVTGMMVILSFLYPFFFGPTRLDVGRANTHLVVIIALFVSTVLFSIKDKKLLYLILPSYLILSGFWIETHREKPFYLCCSTSKFEKIREEVLNRAKKEEIPRPSFANPDLGAISWHKDFNIVDMGKLGSPVLARLNNPVVIKDYIFKFVAPDFIELHDIWSCSYSYIFADKRFENMYEPLWEEKTPWLSLHCRKFPYVKTGVWIRKDIEKNSGSKERKFLNYLASNLSLKRIKYELKKCQGKSGITACQYVTRNVYRFIPELVRKGNYKGVLELFTCDKASNYDLAILSARQSSVWYRKVISFLYRYELKKIVHPENLVASGKLEVYIKDGHLLILNKSCQVKFKEGVFNIKFVPSKSACFSHSNVFT